MLFILKTGISHRALNHLKRLAAFNNPEFYKAQAMRMPNYKNKIPRIISCSDETEDYLCLPRGCEADVRTFFAELKIEPEFIEKTNLGRSIDIEFNGSLRDEQPLALDQLLKHDIGVLSGTTAFGKTVVAINLIAERKVNTLIIVDKVNLVTQWKNRLTEFLTINEALPVTIEVKKRGQNKANSTIGQLGAGKDNLSGIIDIAVMQSLEVISLTGGMGVKRTREIMTQISETPADKQLTLVATGKYIGEGFDEPRLDTLFLVMPISWKGTLQQYAGRLHRLFGSKNEVQIYDYVDIHVRMLERMYHKRLKGYATIGYKAKGESNAVESIDVIFDKSNFLSVYTNDIINAAREILIVSPFVTKRRTLQMMQHLKIALENKVRVIVITRPLEDFKDKNTSALQGTLDLLKVAGVSLVFKSNIHQKYAVIDQRIVWYGSINLLSFGSAEESIMRLDSPNIANELIMSVDK